MKIEQAAGRSRKQAQRCVYCNREPCSVECSATEGHAPLTFGGRHDVSALCKVLSWRTSLPCESRGRYVAGDVGETPSVELLKFCLARVKFHAGKPKDLQMLESLPRLIGELRAATKPLLLCLRNYTVKNAVDDAMAIDDCCMLLRNVTASMWAMMSLLASTRRPLPISPGVLKLVRKLLELAPGCNAFANERVEKHQPHTEAASPLVPWHARVDGVQCKAPRLNSPSS